ncbi:uncharacterized protein LOC143911209 [Arctopsyche grandis]|uniref:uncharacterized protein LOC143911209 n=1 Tax=Arctopsyche grandis TaxID=121162 RepID=UPI00406D667D
MNVTKKNAESEESSSSSSSNSSEDEVKVRDKLKKIKKKIKKEERRAEKRLKKKLKREKKKLKRAKKLKEREQTSTESEKPLLQEAVVAEKTSNIPISLMDKAKAMAPMTKEEWEKRQAVVRRVLDEESGRYRLIKGDGEVLEEIVPQKRHKEINKQASQADGAYFQSVLNRK